METSNPYEPSPHSHNLQLRYRRALTSTEVFTIGAVISLLVLMFAQAQPHPKEYTVTEKILLMLTTN